MSSAINSHTPQAVPRGTAIPGYEVERVEAWIAAHTRELAPPFSWYKLEGGHSNLTYKLLDNTGRVAVIRRPPQGELLPMSWALGNSSPCGGRRITATRPVLSSSL